MRRRRGTVRYVATPASAFAQATFVVDPCQLFKHSPPITSCQHELVPTSLDCAKAVTIRGQGALHLIGALFIVATAQFTTTHHQSCNYLPHKRFALHSVLIFASILGAMSKASIFRRVYDENTHPPYQQDLLFLVRSTADNLGITSWRGVAKIYNSKVTDVARRSGACFTEAFDYKTITALQNMYSIIYLPKVEQRVVKANNVQLKKEVQTLLRESITDWQ